VADRLKALIGTPADAKRLTDIARAAERRDELVDKLLLVSGEWRRISIDEETARVLRDRAIRAGAAGGLGIREIARTTGLSPALISRIVGAA